MKKVTLKSALIELIRYEITSEPISHGVKEFITEEVIVKLYKLCKFHDLSHLIASALNKNGLLDGLDIKETLTSDMALAVLRREQFEYEIERISKALNKENIPFIFLKGSVLRRFYPEPWLRTSCDIDVLVKKCDIKRATECLNKNLNYSVKKGTSHDVFLYSESKVHVELHHTLIEDAINKNVSSELDKLWQSSVCVEGSEYQLNNEIFYLYHLAHMAKHFEGGGCGIRPFIDVFIIKNNFSFDIKRLNTLLSKCNLIKFRDAVESLVNVWFFADEYKNGDLLLENYVIKGGTYGSLENSVKIKQAKEGDKKSYLLKRIFLPYDRLKLMYPVIIKHKFLTPIYQVVRWFRILFKGKIGKTQKEIKISNSITESEMNTHANLLKNLGLDK